MHFSELQGSGRSPAQKSKNPNLSSYNTAHKNHHIKVSQSRSDKIVLM